MATDWLAVIATGRRGGTIDATINVGVHCAPLHKLIAEVDGRKYSEIAATFVVNIGYLQDAHRFREWAFDHTEVDMHLLGDILATVRGLALPFLERFVDAPSVRRGCEEYGLREYNLLRLPALEAATGNVEEAQALLLAAIAAVQSRRDAAAAHLGDVATKLMSRLHAREAG